MNPDENRFSGVHPTADELLGYADNELDPEAGEGIRNHLEGCTECRELVEDLAAYPDLEPPGDAYRVDEEERRATLGGLRTRLLGSRARQGRAEEGEPAKVLAFSPAPATAAPGPARALRWWSLAAAAVVVLALGWGLDRQLRLSETEALLRQARANAEVVQLVPSDDRMRSPEASASALGTGGVTVVLEGLFPTRVFAGEIRSPDGNIVLRIEGLEPRTLGIQFYLPPQSLPAGAYRVRLIRDDGEVWPTTFELVLRE